MDTLKDDVVRFRCTKEDKEELKKKAKANKMTLSQYCIFVLFGGVINDKCEKC